MPAGRGFPGARWDHLRILAPEGTPGPVLSPWTTEFNTRGWLADAGISLSHIQLQHTAFHQLLEKLPEGLLFFLNRPGKF